VDPPTLDQVLDLLDAAYDKEPAFGVYLWVKSATGSRRGEMCALRWHDFDLDRREVRLRRAIAKDYDGGLLEKDIKTHASRRLALDEGTVSLLRQHRLRQREHALALGVPLADDALLFANADGKPWRPDVCTNRFSRLRAKLDLEHVRLHDLRHFVASVLIDGGIPISTVSKRLGHSQMSTTLNIYTHALPATDQKAADYLGDLLSKRKPPRAHGA
jgi:integrase